MDISIQYCGSWGYKPRAASLADKLKSNFDIEARLIEGAGGIFDVKLGGNLVYSKHETGSFPDEDELIASLREKIGWQSQSPTITWFTFAVPLPTSASCAGLASSTGRHHGWIYPVRRLSANDRLVVISRKKLDVLPNIKKKMQDIITLAKSAANEEQWITFRTEGFLDT